MFVAPGKVLMRIHVPLAFTEILSVTQKRVLDHVSAVLVEKRGLSMQFACAKGSFDEMSPGQNSVHAV